MSTKTILKIVAAIAIVCLPFMASSCSKDDDKGPITYTYTWDITGVDLNINNDSIAASWMSARSEVNKLVAKALGESGFVVNSSTKTFTIEIERDAKIENYDERVESAILDVKRTATFVIQAEKLPKSATIVIKRDKKTIVNRALQ